MGVALVTAGGVVLAALVGLIVSLVQANEKSSRLLREAETLSKMEPGTPPHRLLEEHLTQSVARYSVEADRRWENADSFLYTFWLLLTMLGLGCWNYFGDRYISGEWRPVFWLIMTGLLVLVVVFCVAVLWECIGTLRRRREKSKKK